MALVSWRTPERLFGVVQDQSLHSGSVPQEHLEGLGRVGPQSAASAAALPYRDHPSFTNAGPSGPIFRTSSTSSHALALRFVRRDTRATRKLEHRRGRGTIHHGDLGITLDRFDRAARRFANPKA